ncbi:MAG: AI-2E family transporter YdiK [Reyranellales bacterium]
MSEQPHDLTRTTLAVLFIGGLIVATFLVVRPFLGATVWATTLVIATWPLMIRAQALFGGRRWPAVTLMTLGLLLIVLLPLSAAVGAIVGHSNKIVALIAAVPNFHMPAPPDWLADVPLIGAPAAEQWRHIAELGASDVMRQVRPYVGTITQWFVGAAGSVGGLFVHLLLTIALAAVLYAWGERAAGWCLRFGRRLAGSRGEAVVVLAGQAIRSVALGVVVTAVAQTFVAGIGFTITGVPQAGLLSAVTLLLCIAQLGPFLVMAPATIWLFVTGATGAGIVLAAFTAMALALDNFLRPFLIKRGADLPLLLILVGVIGGLLSFGLLGLFLGPVVLAVTYTLLQNWMADKDA